MIMDADGKQIGVSMILEPDDKNIDYSSPYVCENKAVSQLQKILDLVTAAQQVCADPNMVETDGHTRWYLSESTLGLAKVLLKALIAEEKGSMGEPALTDHPMNSLNLNEMIADIAAWPAGKSLFIGPEFEAYVRKRVCEMSRVAIGPHPSEKVASGV